MNNKVSIITVVYNGVPAIESTLKSVISQNYANKEFIVIDGNSTDGTQALLKTYEEKIDCLISEPDKGIYDAMNKGIKKSNGDWIIFMNSGDLFCSDTVLSDIFAGRQYDKTGVIYGDSIVAYPFGSYQLKPRAFTKNDKILPFCHQAAFAKRDLLAENPFDLTYKVVADYDQFFRLLTKGVIFHYTDIAVCIYDPTGFSSRNVLRMYKEVATITRAVHSPSYYGSCLVIYIKSLIFKLLPESIICKMKKKYYDTSPRYIKL